MDILGPYTHGVEVESRYGPGRSELGFDSLDITAVVAEVGTSFRIAPAVYENVERYAVDIEMFVYCLFLF